jgi:phenylalanyl-tRNA synthetase beta chain
LAIVLAGPTPLTWTAPVRQRDFYDLKGVVEGLLAQWSPGEMRPEPLADSPMYHPGRSARIVWRGEAIGEFGELHPDLAEAYDLRGRVCIARIDLLKAAAVVSRSAPQFQAIPRFPGTWRDLALVVDRSVAAGAIEEEVRKAAKPYLEDFTVFDVYEGEKIPAGKKSLALRVRLRSPENTLAEEEITGVMDKVVSRLEKQFGATLRA